MTVNFIKQMSDFLDVPTCLGGCGLSRTRHREGCIYLGVIHYAERRFTRPGARNYLMLVARMWRESDPQYLNSELFDWWYVHHDSVEAARLAQTLGFRFPARLFNDQRRLCRLLAVRRGVHLSRHPKVYQWVNGR